jgi:hypothetical protein
MSGRVHEAPAPRGRRGSLDPALLFGISLLVSLVLWWPSLRAALSGNIDITVAGLRYLAALGLSWLAVFGVGTLIAGYAHDEPPSPPSLPPASAQPLRRAEDPIEDVIHDTNDVPEQPAA